MYMQLHCNSYLFLLRNIYESIIFEKLWRNLIINFLKVFRFKINGLKAIARNINIKKFTEAIVYLIDGKPLKTNQLLKDDDCR